MTTGAVVQLASALAHLHSLQPELPHGRLSTSVIAVTSAADISLGRCITAFARRDVSPSSKRMHFVEDQEGPPDELECEPESEPLVHESMRPDRLPRFSLGPRLGSGGAGVSLAFPPSPDSCETPKRHSVCSLTPSLDSLTPHGRVCTVHRTSAPWRPDLESVDAAMHSLCLQKSHSSEDPSVSSAELPGVGIVFKVSVPGYPRPHSARETLFEAAEAAVWSRSGKRPLPGGVWQGCMHTVWYRSTPCVDLARAQGCADGCLGGVQIPAAK